MMAISSCSCFTRSARPPFWYSSTDSWRCLIIFCSSGSTSASPSGGLPAPRASISAFLSVELTMRSVETARSFLAFWASIKALLMSSRSMAYSQPSGVFNRSGNLSQTSLTSPHSSNQFWHVSTLPSQGACLIRVDPQRAALGAPMPRSHLGQVHLHCSMVSSQLQQIHHPQIRLLRLRVGFRQVQFSLAWECREIHGKHLEQVRPFPFPARSGCLRICIEA